MKLFFCFLLTNIWQTLNDNPCSDNACRQIYVLAKSRSSSGYKKKRSVNLWFFFLQINWSGILQKYVCIDHKQQKSTEKTGSILQQWKFITRTFSPFPCSVCTSLYVYYFQITNQPTDNNSSNHASGISHFHYYPSNK